MTFSLAVAGELGERPRRCAMRAGRPCFTCGLVLEDYAVEAGHLLEARHGALERGGGCRPSDCPRPGGFLKSCRTLY